MGHGVRKSPLETMGGKYGATVAGYFPPGFGSELVREALRLHAAGQRGVDGGR